ncbi:MAG: hypothetical protein R2755_15070 [Acidimicrobiales bacterium]
MSTEAAFRSLRWLDHGDRPALHLEPGGGDDRVLSYRELGAAIRARAAERRSGRGQDGVRGGAGGADGRGQDRAPAGPGGDDDVAVADRPHAADQVVEVLAALVAGGSVLPLNAGWWPRERDAALDRLADARHGPAAAVGPALWLATAGSEAEPTPFAFTVRQLAATWAVPTDGLRAGDRVLLTGDAGHAPVLRSVIGALAAGATVQVTGRAHLAALLAAAPIERLVTTPLLLRRALRQLQRRGRRVAGVGTAVLHQGAVRAHEHERWPTMLDGTVWERVSSTEAGGWLPPGWRSGAGAGVAGERTGTADSAGRRGRGARRSRWRPAVGRRRRRPGVEHRPHPDRRLAQRRRGHRRAPGLLRRRRDHFIADGVLVDPVAVEAALASHPLVADVAVAPRPHPTAGNVVVAVLIPSDPEWPPFLEDLAACCAALPEPARPAALAIVDDLPFNAAGTVSRRLVNYEEAGR